MRAPILTDEVIKKAMQRAEQAVCGLDHRCYGFPYDVNSALATLRADGFCTIGFVVGAAGRNQWDAWYHLDTGEGRLKRQPDRP